jgi:putative hydrolase of the HAD superfamily
LQKLFAVEGVKPQDVLVMDDMEDNLQAAKDAGAKTAWVHPDAVNNHTLQGESPKRWDIQAPSFLALLKT